MPMVDRHRFLQRDGTQLNKQQFAVMSAERDMSGAFSLL